MKRILFCLALVAAALPVPQVFASNVDFSVGINIGSRPHFPVVVAPAPPVPVVHAPRVVVHPAPGYGAPCPTQVVTHRYPAERVHYFNHHRPAYYWGDRYHRYPHNWRGHGQWRGDFQQRPEYNRHDGYRR